MKRFSLFIIVIQFLAFPRYVLGQVEVSFHGYIKDLQSALITEIDQPWITDNILHNRLNLDVYLNNHVTFHAGLRNRLVWGELLEMESTLPDSLLMFKYSDYINDEKGWLDLSDFLIKKKSFLIHSTFDRLYFDYSGEKFQLRIGRQRINWSQTLVWNPNDIFNAYSYFDFDYEEKPGSDAIKLSWYTGTTSMLETAVKLDYKDRITAAARYRFTKWNFDFQFLGGIYQDDNWIVGTGSSGNFLKGALRYEASYFIPAKNSQDSQEVFIMSLGYDYTFNNSLMIQLEGLYQSNGLKKSDFDVNSFYFLDVSARNLSPARWTFVASASYPLTPLLNTSLATMYSPNLKFIFLGPTFSYSLEENLEFSFILQHFRSLDNDSSNPSSQGSYLFLRFKKSF